MRKLMKILSFCLIIGSFLTTISFAESNVVESLKEVETDSKTEEVDYNISPMKLEADIDFDKWERWNKKTNVGMWKDESHVNVWIENQGSSSFTFTVADNSFFNNPIAVETIRP